MIACLTVRRSTRSPAASPLGARVAFTSDRSGQPNLTLDRPGGPRLHPHLRPSPAALPSVWTADLNRDGRTDDALNLSWNGNGIQVEASVALFLLPNRMGYRASAIDTMLFDPRAVVRTDPELPSVIHTALVPARDGGACGTPSGCITFCACRVTGWCRWRAPPSGCRTGFGLTRILHAY